MTSHERHGVPNYHPLELLKSNIKETSKIRTAGPLCEGTKPCNPSQKEGPVVRKACPCRDVIIIHAAIHYSDVIMSAIASQITSLAIFYSTVQSGADERKHQSSASPASVMGIHWWLVNSPHKGPVTRKIFPFDDVIMPEPTPIAKTFGLCEARTSITKCLIALEWFQYN